jgi:hypothetical protein
MSWNPRYVVAWVLPMCGCLLDVNALEAGDFADDEATDESDGDSTDESTSDSDGDSDGDSTETETGDGDADECLEGTALADEKPVLAPPDCEIECATGWGHGGLLLEHEWTIDLDVELPAGERWDHLVALDDGRVLVAVSGDPVRLFWLTVSPEGVGLVVEEQSFSGRVFDLATSPDGDGEVYVLWENEGIVSLTEFGEQGEITTGLGDYGDYYSKMVALEVGVAVALNPAQPGDDAALFFVNEGWVTGENPVPITWAIDRTPSNGLVIANLDTVTWIDNQGDVVAEQPLPGPYTMLGLSALDEQNAAVVGSMLDNNASLDAFAYALDHDGENWWATYGRALAWCDGEPTEEMFVDVARRPDGTLIVGGFESPDYPLSNAPVHQPWVAHVGVDGEVLATDRGLWVGRVLSIAANDEAAYVLMTERHNGSERLHVRKYPL